MTIPAGNNWCPTCEEVCHDHASVCTVCGATLTAAPSTATTTATNHRDRGGDPRAAQPPTIRTIASISEVLPELRQINRDLQEMTRRVRQQIQQTEADQARLWEELQQARREWETAPAEWMDPSNNGGGSANRPVSQAYLKKMPRTVLHKHSSILWQSLVAMKTEKDVWSVEGTMGDFGIPLTSDPFDAQGAIIQALPHTGRGGVLSEDCLAQIRKAGGSSVPFLLYFDRGDTTFVQKALLAQKSGAVACLIGNHVADPWPCIMTDSKGEAIDGNLRIPTVLIPKHAALKLKKSLKDHAVAVRLDISEKSTRDCVVCTESLAEGATVIQIPDCGHLFHEDCALPWLQKHNTCMYCRRELPTDDPEYEQERRRTQRTHAGSAPQQNTEFHNFYG